MSVGWFNGLFGFGVLKVFYSRSIIKWFICQLVDKWCYQFIFDVREYRMQFNFYVYLVIIYVLFGCFLECLIFFQSNSLREEMVMDYMKQR